MNSETKHYWIGFGRRFAVWACLLGMLGCIQLKRDQLQMLDMKAGNGEVTFYVMPSALGLEYFPEVYADTFLQIRGPVNYSGLPFSGPQFEASVEKYFPAPALGYFYSYYHSNGGRHWTASLAVPMWFVGLLFATLLAFVVRPRWNLK